MIKQIIRQVFFDLVAVLWLISVLSPLFSRYMSHLHLLIIMFVVVNRIVGIPNVTTCLMVPSFQMLMRIVHPNGAVNFIHRRMIDFCFSHLVAFSSPGIGYRAVVFQERKTCAFSQSNAFVLVA